MRRCRFLLFIVTIDDIWTYGKMLRSMHCTEFLKLITALITIIFRYKFRKYIYPGNNHPIWRHFPFFFHLFSCAFLFQSPNSVVLTQYISLHSYIYTKTLFVIATILILKTKYFLISYSSISPPSWLRPLLPSPFSLKLHGKIWKKHTLSSFYGQKCNKKEH